MTKVNILFFDGKSRGGSYFSFVVGDTNAYSTVMFGREGKERGIPLSWNIKVIMHSD